EPTSFGRVALDPPAATAPSVPSSAAFPRGTWDVELSGSYVQPIRFSRDRMGVGTVGLGYYLFDNFSFSAAASGYYVRQPEPGGDQDAIGAGLDGMLRWHFLTLGRATLYADGGGG